MLSHRLKNILFDVISSPFFLALPVALVVIVFLPNLNSKYIIEQDSKTMADKKESKIVFCDLNSDGLDEQVIAFHNAVNNKASVKVKTNDDVNYDAWNFNGYFQELSENFYCADFDKDGFAEIYVFYYRDDSAFMAVIQPYPQKRILLKNKLITVVTKRDGSIDFATTCFRITDLDKDGNSDLLFLFNAGYSWQPRVVVAYLPANKRFIKSSSTGAKYNNIQVIDYPGLPTPRVFVSSSTAANIPDSLGIPYNDYYSWYFGFNNKLKPLFKPVKNSYYPSGVNICKFESDAGEHFIAALFSDKLKKTTTLRFYKNGTEEYSVKEFKNQPASKDAIMFLMENITFKGKHYLLIGIDSKGFLLVNEKAEMVRVKRKTEHLNRYYMLDVNKNGFKEFVGMSIDNNLFIYDKNLNHPATFKTGILPFLTKWFTMGIKHNGSRQNQLYIKTDNYLYLYSYKPNKLYYLKYPVWLLIYLVIVLILWGSQQMHHIQVKRKQVIEETINSLRMKTIKSQMDPHFMFNVLNGMANNVASGNSKDAHRQILQFSQLLRNFMKRTDRIDITLDKEIEFINSYLELEKFRFKDSFDFMVEVDKSVNQRVRIPRMLIQLLVENAIKHGLRNKEGVKKLLVKVFTENGKIKIFVEDNGVGRKAAMKTTRDTGKGLKLIKDMIRLNRKLGGIEITLNYTDLYDHAGIPAGTRAEVVLEPDVS